MMTFYSAVGRYRLKTENGRKVPYIQKLGKLHPISIPEFYIWSTLLWEVMTYQELKEYYDRIRCDSGIKMPELDQMLDLLVSRKLVLMGIGYTGADALYDMLSDAFVVPFRMNALKRAWNALRLWVRGRLSFRDLSRVVKPMKDPASETESVVCKLVRQTPLSTAELIRCLDRGILDVSTPDKVIAGIYPEYESDQLHIANEQVHSQNRSAVLEAVSNLYLSRRVILETC